LIYAIDFGTSNSLLAAAHEGRVIPPIPLDSEALDPTILRSILYFPSMKEVFYGSRAIQEFIARDMQGRLIRSIKRFLPVRSFIGTYVEERPVNLEDVIGFFLAEMRKRANLHFKKDVDSVVLGRPAKFAEDPADDQFAQYRLERAARNAGFKHIEFCPEPIAAAFSFREQLTEPKTVLVADFGGGTSDFTVIRISREEYKPSDVLSIGGVSVAGDALDGSVMRHRISPYFGSDVHYKVPFGSNVLKMPTYLMERICAPAEISLLRRRDTLEFFQNVRQWSLGDEDREKMDRLFSLIEDQLGFQVFEQIEKTKRALSESDAARFVFDYPDVDISLPLSRAQFDETIQAQSERILKSLDETVQAAGLTHDQIDIVCCTGGTAKVPLLHQNLIARFGSSKLQEHNRFHSIVQGLSERARAIAQA
jgi:hypothetical chaperone protein